MEKMTQRFETKYDLLNAAYNDDNLKKGTILLLQYLVHKSNKEQCFPAVETIAKALNVCKRTVQYNMRKLEKAGYIIRKDRWYNHQQLTNQYVFNLGVTEENVSGRIRYTEEEKAQINQIVTSNMSNKDDEVCQDGQTAVNKAVELLKIYNMPLSSREKLLLIYLFHRADRKGMVYDIPEIYMNAIGVGKITLGKLLEKLRSKNLIRIKCEKVSGRKLLLLKLTGNVWQEEKASKADRQQEVDGKHTLQQNLQNVALDHNQELAEVIQIIQKETGQCKRKSRNRFWKWIQKLFVREKNWKKCRDIMQFGIKKIRVILRL